MKPRRFEPVTWCRAALRAEVGQLAAAEAVELPLNADLWDASLLYTEPEPPGRDVWLGHSRVSGRIVELVYHADRRDGLLRDALLPRLRDTNRDELTRWSVFDLSCSVPAGFELSQRRLNAGDLSLTFSRARDWVTVRQVGPAQLALSRSPLEGWIHAQERAVERYYRPVGQITLGERVMQRRRRFLWMWWITPQAMTIARHDRERDRIVIVQSTNRDLAERVRATVGRVG